MIRRLKTAMIIGALGVVWPHAGIPAMASSSRTIVPGQRIGLLALKSYPGQLPLGTPQAGDAGMSQHEYLWVSKRRVGNRMVTEKTFAKAVSNGVFDGGGPGVTIETIRVTSPYFRTADGIGPGASLASIRRHYRHLETDSSVATVLEDSARGIAFEFASAHPSAASRCIAVSVFKPGTPLVWVASQVDQLSGH